MTRPTQTNPFDEIQRIEDEAYYQRLRHQEILFFSQLKVEPSISLADTMRAASKLLQSSQKSTQLEKNHQPPDSELHNS